jgi:cytochrome c oxidase subunit IV
MATHHVPHPPQARVPHVEPLPVGMCLAIYAVLLILTAVTVGAAFLDMSWLNTPVALIIATAKALLVMAFFMELRHSSKLFWIAIGNGVFWLLVMIMLTMSDFISRGWLGFPGK